MRAPRASTLTVVAIYLALTVVSTVPVSLRPHQTLWADAPDTHLFMWTLAWDTHALVRQPFSIFNANIFHPYDNTLAYSENLIGSAFIAAPVLWLTGNPVLALNVVSLLTIVLCGLGAYLLGRRLGLSREAAFVCGLIFAFAPPRLFRTTQLHMAGVQWIPFALASLHAYLDTGRRGDLRRAAAFFTLQALTSGHGAVFLIVAIVVLLVAHRAGGEPVALARRLRDLGVSGLVLLAPAALLVLPYRAAQADVGLRRSLENWETSAQSFLASPTHAHAWLMSSLGLGDPTVGASAYLFPGVLPLALAAAAFWPTRRAGDGAPTTRRHDPRYVYGALIIVGVLVSAGPPIGLWPLIYDLPGFDFIRVPSRFSILAVLGLAVMAGCGFDRVWPGRRPAAKVIAVTAVLVVEFAAIPIAATPYRLSIPAADRWLAQRDARLVVAEMPAHPSERLQTTYMLHSMAHWRKTIHGYSGIRPPLHEELYRQLRAFPSEETLRRLTDLGVTDIVVHATMYSPGEWPDIEARLAAFPAWLQLRYQDRESRIYALRKPE